MFKKNMLILHRYLAVAVGVLMTLWCLSGFVMMYQGYPSLTLAERLRGLEPLNLASCCDLTALPDDDQVAPDFYLEMLNGDPVLRFSGGFGRREAVPSGVINLRTGEPLPELSPAEVLQVAELYREGAGLDGASRSLGTVEIDQWIMQSARRNSPAHHIAFDNEAGTEIYVNGSTGEVFQDTNRRERVLTWLGAIPHWLYPLALRQNAAVWSQLVIWTAVIGTFLTITGLYVGITHLHRRRQDGRWASPFRGWWYWHHISGLVFGILTLTWVFSGLMTMNPWGALESRGGGPELRNQINGSASWGAIRQFLDAVSDRLPPGPEFTQLQAIPFNGQLHVLARSAEGARLRLDASAAAAVLKPGDVEVAMARIGVPGHPVELLEQEDHYYYGHKSDIALPVYRVILDDADRTRLYINAETGSFRAVDANARMSRWIRRGLHGLDFAGLRVRPFWDLVTLLLLTGVTVVCGSGAWMALKRVKHDFGRLRARLNRRVYDPAPEVSRR